MYQRTFTRFAICAISMSAILLFSLLPEAIAQQALQQRGLQQQGSVGTERQGKFVEPLANKDLEQLRGYRSEEIGPGWTIEGKHLVCDGSDGGDIMTKETYSDFELQVDWRIEEGGNSGIMFRVTTGDEAPYMSGPEFQILDDEAHADGSSELTSAGALYGLYPATGKKPRAAGTWNKSRIIVEGNKITHFLNGTKVVDAEIGSDDWNKRLAESKFKDWEKFAKATEGHICFQDHGDPVRFRNIRIKRLDQSEDNTKVSAPRRKKNMLSGRTGRAADVDAADEDAPDSRSRGKKSEEKDDDGGQGAQAEGSSSGGLNKSDIDK